tara:strand:+ start:220 stop:480 length:261 start_codon:yes stop_codon:yes gene_type:complete
MSDVETQTETPTAPTAERESLPQRMLDVGSQYLLHAVKQILVENKTLVLTHGAPDDLDGSHFMVAVSVDPAVSQKIIDSLSLEGEE